MMKKKYIFITGGVVSSLGKGVATGALGALFEARQLKVNLVKMDPYLNIDPGTMSPVQHGEVFVTEDGAETDLDLGHYERFVRILMTKNNCFTAGQVYADILNKERQGKYLGGTVQTIPHVTDNIKEKIALASGDADIVLIEIGGTVGDIESLPFLEAIRQLRIELGPENTFFVHLTLVPYVSVAKELKTKPTQHAVKELRNIGIQPDMLICRSEKGVSDEQRQKIALFTNVSVDAVINLPDVDPIYSIPQLLQKQNVDTIIANQLQIEGPLANLHEWDVVLRAIKNSQYQAKIAIVGKYVTLDDSYKSITEALYHAGIQTSTEVKIQYLSAEQLEQTGASVLAEFDGILLPGGFGARGAEGKISAIQYAREHHTPFLGICFGMQLAVVEYARNKLDWKGANSIEINPQTPYPVVVSVEPQVGDVPSIMGGTLRLGGNHCHLVSDSLAAELYGRVEIVERHRHRYQVNNILLPELVSKGLHVVGYSQEKSLVEMIELPDHPWFVACQFHPEFSSTPRDSHPLFSGFVKAARKVKDNETI